MATTYHSAIGRRKTAVAQVRLIPGGNGKVTVNGRVIEAYFTVPALLEAALAPLKTTGKLETMDVTVRTIGGGIRGQADAVCMGVARALVKYDESLKLTVKAGGYLTRDDRKKERKKFGKRGARRSPQWRKR
jgi:small subunit ribosomal protein S9